MKKRTKKELDQIFGFMMEKFPNADTELIYHNGFQLLVAVRQTPRKNPKT